MMATPKLRIEPTIGPMVTSQQIRAPQRSAPAPAARPAIVSLLASVYLASGIICAALLVNGYADRDPLEFVLGWPYPTLLLCGVAVAAGCLLLVGVQAAWYLAAIVLIDSLALAVWEAQQVFHATLGAVGGATSVGRQLCRERSAAGAVARFARLSLLARTAQVPQDGKISCLAGPHASLCAGSVRDRHVRFARDVDQPRYTLCR